MADFFALLEDCRTAAGLNKHRNLDEVYEILTNVLKGLAEATTPPVPVTISKDLRNITKQHRPRGRFVLVAHLEPEHPPGGHVELLTDPLESVVLAVGPDVPASIAAVGETVICWRGNAMEIGVEDGPPRRRLLMAINCEHILAAVVPAEPRAVTLSVDAKLDALAAGWRPPEDHEP